MRKTQTEGRGGVLYVIQKCSLLFVVNGSQIPRFGEKEASFLGVRTRITVSEYQLKNNDQSLIINGKKGPHLYH